MTEESTAKAIGTPTAGQLLRQARERAGMQVAVLAAQTKIAARKIHALEEDQLQDFSSPVFARSLTSTLCRAMKADATPILALLPQAQSPVLTHHSRRQDELPVQFRDQQGSHHLSLPSRANLWLAGGLVVLALLVAFIPDLSSRLGWVPASAPGPTAEEAPALASPVPVTETPVGPQGIPTAANGASPVVQGSPADKPVTPAVPAAQSAPAPSLASDMPKPSTPAVAVPNAAAVSATTSAPGPVNAPLPANQNGILGLATSADSWIQVYDAKGQVLLNRLLSAGEKLALDGALPLRVVVGRADATQVTVRGQPFPTTGIAQANVARFEVK